MISAAQWYEMAAAQGDSSAQLNLSNCYRSKFFLFFFLSKTKFNIIILDLEWELQKI